MPPELQQRVQEEVELTKRRSGWPVERTLSALGVSRTTYYRWQRAAALRVGEGLSGPPPQPVQPYEALPEEKAAVKEYALKHPELRHRELAWRMVDEDVAYVSSSTVYRILREAKLVCPWSRRTKRRREEEEKASRPNQIWATDIKYVWVGERHYFLVSFLDEYSRYIVHHELLWGMDGATVSVAAQAALETLPKDAEGKLLVKPEIRSDNGSCYISREFGGVLDEHESEPSADQAALPGGERPDGAGEPHARRGPGGGRIDGLPSSGEGDCPDDPMVQRAAFAQCR